LSSVSRLPFLDNEVGGIVTQPACSRAEIELRAYHSWEARGRPFGSPEVDWFDAERELAAIEPEGVLSKVAREVGSALGSAVALLSDLKPVKGESS
jgi:Protein of unknown function (DUF2934)